LKTEIQISVLPEEVNDLNIVKAICAKALEIPVQEIQYFKIKRRSMDARGKVIKFVLKVLVIYKELDFVIPTDEITFNFKQADPSKTVVIVGAGPAGYFSALRLLEEGIKPIVIERGQAVKERRRDLVAITQQHLVNPNSNYCFGEGGAGTYSDGKLYTRATKRGNVSNILELLVYHGAEEDILVEAHPHIGSNKLPQIITNIRQTILNHGGEIYFNEQVIDFKTNGQRVDAVITKNTINGEMKEYKGNSFILAAGHSARDIFEWFYNNNYLIEQKPFALGVRIEHPQELIDEIQYRKQNKSSLLPPASYSLVTQALNKGVFSFCMCPGGIIAPSATAPGEIVTNGWSPSKRDGKFANSGLVAEVKPEDYLPYKDAGPLAGLRLQQHLEKAAFVAAGEKQTAPAQRMVDFLNNKLSTSLPSCSYIPGIASAPINTLLPPNFSAPMQEAFKIFDRSIKGYLTNEAVLVGFETRTSSPVRIPRDPLLLTHSQLTNLYPCGEGAGYAGGIVSAAIDGQRCAKAFIDSLA